MGTQVLQPQDCLIKRIGAPPAAFSYPGSSASYCNNYYYSSNRVATSRSHRKPVTRSDPRKRTAVSSGQPEAAPVSKKSSADDSVVARSSGLDVEKVTILRRGQSLDSSLVAVKSDMYAGSAVVSPSPSALPLPSFFTKKQLPATFDNSATRDLRRLLRLE